MEEQFTEVYFSRKIDFLNVYDSEGNLVKSFNVLDKTRHEEISDEPIQSVNESHPVCHKAKLELEKLKQRRKAKSDSLLHALSGNIREDKEREAKARP